MAALDEETIRQALARLGVELRVDHPVEILIVGGAAGVLIGSLPAAWTTTDVDLIHCHLPTDRDAVLAASVEAGKALGLSGTWLSEDVGLYAWTLPAGWEARRVLVGGFVNLRVYAASRMDLIAMKFLAHRHRDMEHLALIRPSEQELEFCVRCFHDLEIDHPNELARIQLAREFVQAWRHRT